MTLFTLVLTFSFIIGFLSMIYKKNFFLSILISLEVILLNVVIFNFSLSIINGCPSFSVISLFILALAAVEASIGISIITLISRNFQNSNINSISTLKN